MPTISMFFGIIVSIFYEDTSRHHKPHIHVRYQGKKAAIAIDDGSVLVIFRQNNFGWFRFGSIFIKKNYWLIGNW